MIKTFEQHIDKQPKKGNWIIDVDGSLGVIDDVSSKVIYLKKFYSLYNSYLVSYGNDNSWVLKLKLKTMQSWKDISTIKHYGTKKEMEILFHAKKYNLW